MPKGTLLVMRTAVAPPAVAHAVALLLTRLVPADIGGDAKVHAVNRGGHADLGMRVASPAYGHIAASNGRSITAESPTGPLTSPALVRTATWASTAQR